MPSCCRLFLHCAPAGSLPPGRTAGNNSAARTQTIRITTSSSTNVKPSSRRMNRSSRYILAADPKAPAPALRFRSDCLPTAPADTAPNATAVPSSKQCGRLR